MTGAVGDLLLTFGAVPQSLPARCGGEAWEPVQRHGAGTLWRVAPTDGWAGWALLHHRNETWEIWVVGDAGRKASEVAGALADGATVADVGTTLNGHWGLLVWEAGASRWHVCTDRFATVHLYAGERGGTTAVGTFSPSVMRAVGGPDLDWEALTGFFAFGFFPGDRTFDRSTRVLRPATHTVIDREGTVSSRRYWRWRHRPDPTRPYAGTVGEFGDRLGAVLDRSRDGRIGVPISGGLDSRSTVAALTAPGKGRHDDLWSYSYGYGGRSPEVRIGAEIARRRGLDHEAYVIGEYLFAELPRVVAMVEGFQDVTQTRQVAILPTLADQVDSVVAAHWGDVWLDDMGTLDKRAPRDLVDHAMARVSKRGGERLTPLLRDHLGHVDADGLLRSFIEEELERAAEAGEDRDFQVKVFKTEQWSFRWTTASLRTFQSAARPILPFYDNELADFFCTIPSTFVRGRRMQIDYLCEHAPDLAAVEWQQSRTDLFRARAGRPLGATPRLARRLGRALRAPLPSRNWEVQLLGPGGPDGLQRWLLDGGLKLHDVVDSHAVAAEIDELRGGRSAASGYAVSMLLTVSSWLECFA